MKFSRTPFAVLLILAALAVVYGSFKLEQRSATVETGEEPTGVRDADRSPSADLSAPDVSPTDIASGHESGLALIADGPQQHSIGAQDSEPIADNKSQITVVKTEFSEFPSGFETTLVARIASLSYEEALVAFQGESVDPVWAADKADLISSALPGTLTGKVSSTNLTCRSTSCLVELYGDADLADEPKLLIDLMRMANDVGGTAALNVDQNDLRRGLLVIEWPES